MAPPTLQEKQQNRVDERRPTSSSHGQHRRPSSGGDRTSKTEKFVEFLDYFAFSGQFSLTLAQKNLQVLWICKFDALFNVISFRFRLKNMQTISSFLSKLHLFFPENPQIFWYACVTATRFPIYHLSRSSCSVLLLMLAGTFFQTV